MKQTYGEVNNFRLQSLKTEHLNDTGFKEEGGSQSPRQEQGRSSEACQCLSQRKLGLLPTSRAAPVPIPPPQQAPRLPHCLWLQPTWPEPRPSLSCSRSSPASSTEAEAVAEQASIGQGSVKSAGEQVHDTAPPNPWECCPASTQHGSCFKLLAGASVVWRAGRLRLKYLQTAQQTGLC